MRSIDIKQLDDMSSIAQAHDDVKEEGLAEGLKKENIMLRLLCDSSKKLLKTS